MKVVKGFLKFIMWLLIVMFGIALIAVIALYIPPVQRWIAGKASDYLTERTGTRFEISRIGLSFPFGVQAHGIYVEDEQHDTLLAGNELRAEIDPAALFHKRIELYNISARHLTAHVTRNLPDSSYNFDFIISAFAGDTVAQDTVVPAWEFFVSEIDLEGVYLTYDDKVVGTDARLLVGDLNTGIGALDMEQMKFRVKHLFLSDSYAFIEKYKVTTSLQEQEEASLKISAGDIDLDHIKVIYTDKVNEQQYLVNMGSSLVKEGSFDMTGELVAAEKVFVGNTHAYAVMKNASPVDSAVTKVKQDETPVDTVEWVVKIGDIGIEKSVVLFHSKGAPALPQAVLDPNHLYITGLNADINDFYVKGEQLTADIDQLSARDRSGLYLKQLATNVAYGPAGIELAHLDLRLNNSRLGNYIKISYPSLGAAGKSPERIRVNASFANTSIAVTDVLMLDTSLASIPALAQNKRSKLELSGKVQGRVSSLTLKDLRASTGYATRIHVNGTIKGLPNIDTTHFDLKLNKVATSARDIRSFVPDTLIPQNIALPSMISMNGSFSGTFKEFKTEIDMRSSFGGAELILAMDTIGQQTTYAGTVELNRFNIGKLLKQQERMGAVSGNMLFEGEGLSVDSMDAVVNANIQSASINSYTYSNLNLFARIKDERISTEATVKDTSISLVMSGRIDISGRQPAFDVNLFLDGANLQKLNFTKDDIRVQASVNADFKGTDIDSINGRVALSNVLLIRDQQRFTTDSIVVTAFNEGDSTRLTLRSPIASGELAGQVKLTEAADALAQHFESYLKDTLAGPGDTAIAGAQQNFRFHIDVKNPAMITEVFLPKLQLSTGSISGRFNKEQKQLLVQGHFPRVSYGDNQADSIRLNINSNRDSLAYSLSVDEVYGRSYQLDSTVILGVMSDGKMTSRLSISEEDTTGHELLIAGKTGFDNGTYRFHTDSVVIDYEEWEVPRDNYVQFGKQGLYFHNLRWENGERYIAVNNTSESVINIGVNKFDVGKLASIAAVDTPLIGGLATGTVQVITGGERPVIDADLELKSFTFRADTLGALTLDASNRQGDRYQLALGLHERGNHIDLTGYYDPDAEQNSLDLQLTADTINLSTFEGFSMGFLKKMKGTLGADLTIKGEIDDPDIEGTIAFDKVVFRPTYLNSPFTITNEKVYIERSGIYFNSLVLTDSLGNKALLDGVVYTTNFQYFQFNLTIKTKEFLALNTSKRDNSIYYGRLFMNSIIRIEGSDSRPEIDVLAKIIDGSSLTFIVPENVLAEAEREGVVEFVDFKPDLNPILTEGTALYGDTVVKPEIDIDFTANVEIDEGSEFRIVVNPQTGDSLYVRGTSTFSFGVDPSGKITLIGSYEITEGSYQLSFGNLVKKRFIIQPGSRISWSGDPIAAQVDITAKYKVRTSPLDLVADQVTNLTENERQELRQQMQFLVVLNMQGRLLTPQIDFDIDLPPEQQDAFNGTVYARLFQLNEQESELNQQVFALIVLNRFLPKNPLAASSNAQSALATTARTSASKLLSQQLNELTASYINVVDISMSLDSYQDFVEGEPQGRTNMQVDVRKETLNERLDVEMGGNIELEGPTRSSTKNNGLGDLAADVAVEYKLTKDGRYRLRGIRRTGYVGLFEGRITETGLGVIFVRDYNRFSELFARPREEEVFTDIKE